MNKNSFENSFENDLYGTIHECKSDIDHKFKYCEKCNTRWQQLKKDRKSMFFKSLVFLTHKTIYEFNIKDMNCIDEYIGHTGSILTMF